MSELRATIAIVRRHIDRRFAVDWMMQCALVAIVTGLFGRILTGAYVAVAIAAALAAAAAAERTHATALRRASFFAMPLFGRQLARAHTIAPLVLASSIPLGFVLGKVVTHVTPSAQTVAAVALAAAVATLVSLSSVFRDGANAWLFGIGGALAGIAVTIPAVSQLRGGFAVTVLASVVTGFFALRAFGETLARYDPLAG